MKIKRAEIFLLRLPLLQPINHHTATRSHTDSIVIRLRSNGLEGYGEGTPRSYVTGESAQSAFEILSPAGRHLAGWFDDLLYLEGSFGTWVLQEDIVEEDIRFGRGGHARPLLGKGLGVHVKQETLER